MQRSQCGFGRDPRSLSRCHRALALNCAVIAEVNDGECARKWRNRARELLKRFSRMSARSSRAERAKKFTRVLQQHNYRPPSISSPYIPSIRVGVTYASFHSPDVSISTADFSWSIHFTIDISWSTAAYSQQVHASLPTYHQHLQLPSSRMHSCFLTHLQLYHSWEG